MSQVVRRRAPVARRSRAGLGLAMLTPTAILLAALILVPVGYSAYLALYRWQLIDINGPKTFVGTANFTQLLHDATLRDALRNTVVYVVICVAVELALGFAVAVALYDITKGRRLANSLILLPMIVTPVVTALLWRYLLDPQFGLVSQVLAAFGRPGIDWFGSTSRALPGLMLIDVWQWTPFVVLVLHAGMLAIPEERLEAAAVDGAGRVRRLRHIVAPALVPQILLVLLFRTMDTYRIFDTVYVLTKGGPGDSTTTLGLYAYRTGFSFMNMGYAMVLSLFILLTISLISVFYLVLLRRRGVLRR
jgi:multiple sugar transport system permease protein